MTGDARPPEATASDPSPPDRPRRPPPGRISPEAMAAARGGVSEGLAWLGRAPEAKASLLYRAARLLVRFVCFGLFRFRIETSGQEHLPQGGYLLVAGAHRGWMDPFVVMHALPVEPRCWFLGSGPSTFTTRWREWLIHRIGGLLPVWRGGVGIDQHVASARAVVDAGAVFVQMPEGTVSGPPGRLGAMRTGWAIIALRTDAADRAARDGRHGGAVPRPADGLARAAADDRPGSSPASRRAHRCPRRARARSWRSARAMTDRLAAILGPGRRGAAPDDGRSARAPAPAAPAPDLAAAAAGPPRSRRLTAGPVRLYSPAMQYAESILDLVGNTPLVRITRVTRDLGPRSASRSCWRRWRCSTRAARSRTGSACR